MTSKMSKAGRVSVVMYQEVYHSLFIAESSIEEAGGVGSVGSTRL